LDPEAESRERSGNDMALNSVGCSDTVMVRRETTPDAQTLDQWDQLVDCSTGTDVTQLSAWATIRSQVGYSPIYLLAYRGKKVIGCGLLLRRRLFGVLSVGYMPYGPLVDQSAPAPNLVTVALLDELTELAKSLTLTFVQPPEGADYISEALLARGFRVSHAGVAPAGSYRLDLTQPLEEIRAGFSKRLKSWTNRWESNGVRVRQGDERDLPLLLELMAHTGARQGFAPPSLDQVSTLYRELVSGGHASLFVGEVNGRPVSADLVTMIGGTVRGRRGGFDGSGEARKLSVPAAVRYEIIKWGKEQGYQWFDFGGLPERMLDDMINRGIHTSDDWPSAHRSKLAFNGAPFRYPIAVEMVRPTPVRWAYDVATRRRHGQRLITVAKNLLQAKPARNRSSRNS
jgi:lipid II:glycine glycyltransferase (peptidoglycan interpeptide bridge formation enzyme)